MSQDFSDIQKHFIWLYIKYGIKNNCGIGFANKDQGHPAYVAPKSDGGMGDSPDENQVFKMLSVLDKQFRQEGEPDLSTWEGFCNFAYESYKKTKGYS